MTNFKQYFRSHLKANIESMIYIFLVAILLTFLIGISIQPTSYYDFNTAQRIKTYQSTLYIPVIFISILAYVLPVTEFSFFKKRINLDCAYALPISRKAMGAVHYLTGLISLCGAYTLSYLTNFILLLSRGEGYFNFTPMIGHYILCLIIGFAIYSIMVFVFNEANTKGDGIWFMILYTFVIALAITTIRRIIDDNGRFIDANNLIPWGLFIKINSSYQSIVEIHVADRMKFWSSPESVKWFIIWMNLGIASAVAFILRFGNRRMEKTEEISDSYFGFRTLIPIYAISAMILTESSNYIILWVILELLTFIGYTIYRRGFHYKKSDVITMCMLLIFLFI